MPESWQGSGGLTRRQIMRGGAGLVALGGVPALLAACGDEDDATTAASSGGGGKAIKIGFIALTDNASVVMAEALGYYKKRGLNVELLKQASWPVTRDALLNGDIDMAHCLFGMPFSVAAGIGGKKGTTDLKVAMILNNNGQAITLKSDLEDAGYDDLEKAKATLAGKGKTLAMTFPGGTHDIWLRYWLKAQGINPADQKIIPIPPPQMVANMKAGNMDGYCVGEPWPAVAVKQGIGYTAITSQDIWSQHPEKALVVSDRFATSRAKDLKQVMGAILAASKWLDDIPNRVEAAKVIGTPAFVNAPPKEIEGRLQGVYDLGAGLGEKKFTDNAMAYFRDGQTNFPRRAHGIWFLAEYSRLGYLKSPPNYDALAKELILTDLYKEVAEAEKIEVPDDDMKPFVVDLDNNEFDPTKPEKEASRA